MAGIEWRNSATVTKSVTFRFSSSRDLSSLLDEFGLMCNEAISIAVRDRPVNRFKLIQLAYPELKRHGLHTNYILSACEIAFSVYKNKKRKSIPFIRRPFLKLDNQAYQLNHMILRIPTAPKNFVFLTLEVSPHQSSLVDDTTLKKGSVTITPDSVAVAISRKIEPFEPSGCIGVDINKRNVTVSASNGWHKRFDALKEVVEIKDSYREMRAKFMKSTRGDRRILKKLNDKYGKRERNRTESRIHKVTREIVNYARNHKLAIKMERLKGIRRLYHKGNGRGRTYRWDMNSWIFGLIQRQMDYKAKWDGVPCYFVNAWGTSSNCPCGSRVVKLADRKLYCPTCDITWDRDDLASKNIMACVVPQDRHLR